MNNNKENIEEMSTSAGGSIELSPERRTEELSEEEIVENKLRAIIRETLKLYAIKKNKLSDEQLAESKIREHIRKILLKEKQSKDPPPATTLEGVMRSLLNNIIPQIRLDYMKLQTNDEERRGFKDYFYNAVEQTIDVAHDQMNPEEADKELEEEKVVVKSGEPDFINGVDDGSEKSKKKKGGDAEQAKNISSYYDRGQNFGETAFNSIKDRIEKAVYSQIVPEEYPQFIKVLTSNFKAWFNIWDTNRTQNDPVPDESESDLDLAPDQEEPTDVGSDLSLDNTEPEEMQEDFEIELE